MKMAFALLTAVAAFSLMGGPAAAQEGSDAAQSITVVAKRSGAPMWTIETEQGTVLLVGEIVAVPKSTPWQPDRLEEATAGAQRVILGTKGKVSPGDILRLIFAGGSITRLPRDTVASDYLDARQAARLAAFERAYGKNYARQSLLLTAYDLLSRRLGFTRDTGRDASDVVRRAADRADVPAEPVGTVRGEDMLDSLAEADPSSHLPCLDAAMTATEIGAELIKRRGKDWRSYDVPAVMANPLEVALGQCWPWADAAMGADLRVAWVEAIGKATQQPGVTLAVVPLRVLAEQDGVLDQLADRGFSVSGPDWR